MFVLKLGFIKLIDKIAKIRGQGSSFAGFMDGKLKLNILDNVNLSDVEIILVLGTNGKTTTTNFIYSALSKDKKVISNLEGANLLSGIKTTILRNLKFNKKLDGDILLLEIDELTLKEITLLLEPDKIVITNFFRDQLDRYGEIDQIIDQIVETVSKTKANLYLNGCDPLIVNKFETVSNNKIYYGLDETYLSTKQQSKIIELKYCPHCLKELKYHYYHYGHIGNYECDNCNFKMPKLSYTLSLSKKENELRINDKAFNVDIEKFPMYFYFNIAAAASIILETGDDKDFLNFEHLVENFEFPKGRNQQLEINGKKVYFNLAKNVVGLEETFEFIKQHYNDIILLICFNDNYADGRDVSWIWDVEINGILPTVDEVVICGIRRYDMAMRFEVDGCEKIRVSDDSIYQTVLAELKNGKKDVCIISNYTPLAEVNQALNEVRGVL